MTFNQAKSPSWAFGETLTSAQMNQLDQDHALAVDGSGGGSYTISAPLSFSSAALSFVSLSLLTDVIVIAPGSFMTIASGSIAPTSFNGAFTVADGTTFTWVGSTGWPKVELRTIQYEQPIINVALNPNTRFTAGSSGQVPFLTQSSTVDGGGAWIPITNIPARGTIISFGMDLDGNGGGSSHSNLPGVLHRPKINLVQIDSSGNLVETAAIEDAPANLAAYEARHTVSASHNYVLNGTSQLYAIVSGEDGADAVANSLRVYRVWVVATVTEVGA